MTFETQPPLDFSVLAGYVALQAWCGKAADLEPNKETYTLLLKAYRDHGMHEEADIIEDRLKKLVVPAGRRKRILRPRRVVV